MKALSHAQEGQDVSHMYKIDTNMHGVPWLHTCASYVVQSKCVAVMR